MRPITDAEFNQGSKLPGLAKVRSIAGTQDMVVRLVDAEVREDLRRQIARVAYVAQRATPECKTGYDGTITDADQRLYVLCRGSRAIGLVLSALGERFWLLAWNSDGRLVDAGRHDRRQRATIARIWIAPEEQRKGLGFFLITEVCRHLETPPTELGWELPFTDQGKRLVKKLCPEAILASCDQLTLHNVLRAA